VESVKQFTARQILNLFPDFPAQFKESLIEKLQWEKLGWFNGKVIVNSFFPPIPSKALDSVVRAWRSSMEGQVVPEVATIAITNKCPYNCMYCSVPDKTVNDLPAVLIKHLIKKLQDMGSFNISLTGGEPLLRKDLEDIIAAVDDRSIVKVFTSGYSLTKEKAKALKKAGLLSVSISLDDEDLTIHDQRCGFEGAGNIALRAIENAKKATLLTCVAIVAAKDRILNGEIKRFLEFLQGLGVDEVSIFEPAPTGKLAFRHDVLLSVDERRALEELHKEINGSRSRRYPRVFSFPYVEGASYMGCGAGCTRLHVTALGHVAPCDFSSISFGNIQQENIETIWKRMTRYFNRPECGCFVMNNYKEIREMIDEKTGMADGCLLMERAEIVRDARLPELYKMLMTS